ncbi:Protein DEHYDRATION-INDUCED 19 homolog 5 [Linum grandiflorum]
MFGGYEGHQNDPFEEALLAVREARMAEHFALNRNNESLAVAEVENSECPTPADAISTRPLVPSSTIYQQSDAAGFGSGNEAVLTEIEVIMADHPRELLGHQGDPVGFDSGSEGLLAEIAPIIADNLAELFDDFKLELPERPTPGAAILARPLVPSRTIDQLLDVSHVEMLDFGSEDWLLPQYHRYTLKDIHLRLNESEGDENASACFPCPFCDVDIEVQILCRHLQYEHGFDLKDAVCPLCAASVGKDVTGHFIVQHAGLLKVYLSVQFHNFHAGCPYKCSCSLQQRRKSSIWRRRNIPEPVSDPLLLPFVRRVPAPDSKASHEDNSLNKTTERQKVSPYDEADREERRQKAAFVQELVASTIFI